MTLWQEWAGFQQGVRKLPRLERPVQGVYFEKAAWVVKRAVKQKANGRFPYVCEKFRWFFAVGWVVARGEEQPAISPKPLLRIEAL